MLPSVTLFVYVETLKYAEKTVFVSSSLSLGQLEVKMGRVGVLGVGGMSRRGHVRGRSPSG